MSEIITVGSKGYHIGLTWRSFEDRVSRSELKEISAEIDRCDGAYWITDGARYIWGFATSFDSGKRYAKCSGKKCGGLLALELASRADVLPYAFILRNQNKHAFVVLDKNRIPLPGSDIWYDDESKMQEALAPYAEIFMDASEFSRVLKLAVWNKPKRQHPSKALESTDASPEYDEEDLEEWASLSDYLTNKKVEVTLSGLHYVSLSTVSYKPIGYSVGLILGISLLSYAGYQWYAYHQKPITNIRHVLTHWHPPAVLPKPVAKPAVLKTVADDYFFSVCRSLYRLPYVWYGYKMVSARCDYSESNRQIALRAVYRSTKPLVIPALPQKKQGWSLSMDRSGMAIFAAKSQIVPISKLETAQIVDWQALRRKTQGSHGLLSVLPGAAVGSVTLQSKMGLSVFSSLLHHAQLPVETLRWHGHSWRLTLGQSSQGKGAHPDTMSHTLLRGLPDLSEGHPSMPGPSLPPAANISQRNITGGQPPMSGPSLPSSPNGPQGASHP